MIDPAAIEAGWDLVKTLSPDRARTLLDVLELPGDERWAFISRMYVRDDGEWLAEVLADVEQDLNGKTRERLIAGLHAALDYGVSDTVTENAPLFAVVDIETTGFSPLVGDRIVEIGIVRVGGDGATVDEYVTLVNPLRDIGPTHVHGITQEDVKQAPLFSEVVGDVLARLAGVIFVGHNARYDRDFLAAELSAAGIFLPAIPSLCTLKLGYRLHPELGNHRLATCCEAAGIDHPTAHSAIDDARVTAALLGRYLAEAQEVGVATLKASASTRTSSPIHGRRSTRPGRPPSGPQAIEPRSRSRTSRGSSQCSRSTPPRRRSRPTSISWIERSRTAASRRARRQRSRRSHANGASHGSRCSRRTTATSSRS